MIKILYLLNIIKNSKKTGLLLGILILLLITTIVVIVLDKQERLGPSPVIIFKPSPTPETSLYLPNLSKPFSGVIINKTTDKEVSSLPDIKNITEDNNRQKTYSLSSILVNRDSQIITSDGLVVFIRVIMVTSDYTYPKLKDYQKIYGEPEKEIEGSKYYGKFEKTYLYASKGIVIIANPFTGEVSEIHRFIPMDVEQYIQQWGQDIKIYGNLPI